MVGEHVETVEVARVASHIVVGLPQQIGCAALSGLAVQGSLVGDLAGADVAGGGTRGQHELFLLEALHALLEGFFWGDLVGGGLSLVLIGLLGGLACLAGEDAGEGGFEAGAGYVGLALVDESGDVLREAVSVE